MTWFLAILALIMVALAVAMIYTGFFWTGEPRRKNRCEDVAG